MAYDTSTNIQVGVDIMKVDLPEGETIQTYLEFLDAHVGCRRRHKLLCHRSPILPFQADSERTKAYQRPSRRQPGGCQAYVPDMGDEGSVYQGTWIRPQVRSQPD